MLRVRLIYAPHCSMGNVVQGGLHPLLLLTTEAIMLRNYTQHIHCSALPNKIHE